MLGHEKKVTSILITPDGKLAVTASEDKTIKIWNFKVREEIRTLQGHQGRVADLAFVPSGNRILSASCDGTIKIWDMKTGKNLSTFHGQNGPIRCLAVTKDSKKVVSISSGLGDQGSLKVWDLEKEMVIRSFSTNDDILLNDIEITADGKRAVTVSGLTRHLFVWDLETGNHIQELVDGTGSRKCSLALSADGKLALSGGDNNDITLWDIEKGREVLQLENIVVDSAAPNFWQNPGWYICSVAFINGGKEFMSASGDGLVKIWDAKSGICKSLACINAYLTACAITRDGQKIVAGDKSGQIYFINVKNPK
jgi:WD40 repeat protein